MKTLEFILQFFLTCICLIAVVVAEAKWYQTNFGNKYLIENEQKYNWFQASNECVRRNLQLISVETEEKNLDLIELLKKEFGPINLWLSGNDLYNKAKDFKRPFYWATGHAFSYSYWAPSNPSNYASAEHCVHIWKDAQKYRWNDNVCNHREFVYGYICEETIATQRCKLVDEILNRLVCDEIPASTYIKDL